jgi:hypothetical protein
MPLCEPCLEWPINFAALAPQYIDQLQSPSDALGVVLGKLPFTGHFALRDLPT